MSNPEAKSLTVETLLAAAQRVLGERPVECFQDPDTDQLQLLLVVTVVAQPKGPGDVAHDEALKNGLDCEPGDELLFPIYYLAEDAVASRGQAWLSEFLRLPRDLYDRMRAQLAADGLIDPIPADTPEKRSDDDDGEADSELWRDLAAWAFSRPDLYPSDPTEEQLESLLDEAARTIPSLSTPAAWRSAARYFEAENFHSLEAPASARALASEEELRAGPPNDRTPKR